jgi:hypothetical protein
MKIVRFGDLQSVSQVHPESRKVERNADLFESKMEILTIDEKQNSLASVSEYSQSRWTSKLPDVGRMERSEMRVAAPHVSRISLPAPSGLRQLRGVA